MAEKLPWDPVAAQPTFRYCFKCRRFFPCLKWRAGSASHIVVCQFLSVFGLIVNISAVSRMVERLLDNILGQHLDDLELCCVEQKASSCKKRWNPHKRGSTGDPHPTQFALQVGATCGHRSEITDHDAFQPCDPNETFVARLLGARKKSQCQQCAERREPPSNQIMEPAEGRDSREELRRYVTSAVSGDCTAPRTYDMSHVLSSRHEAQAVAC